jgi:mono/diheme cytochrome c family protein
MKRVFASLVILAAAVASAQEPADNQRFLDSPYERPKNGPPLTNIFHKVNSSWLRTKLKNPKHHPSARMPDFKFTEEEVLDVMAYLKSIAEPSSPSPVTWPAWADKAFEEMTDDEFDATLKFVDDGKKVWGNARCTICHVAGGPSGQLIGGFVDLRVGGVDLQIGGTKLNRDWLYRWIKEPKSHFPDTLMPRFRLSEDQLRAVVEYILRDDAFQTPPTENEEAKTPLDVKVLGEPKRVAQGKRLIQLSRCVICHDVKGISEILPQPERRRPPEQASFEFLADDLRCLTCHSMKGRGGTYAPDLTSGGSRLHTDWIAKFVESPDLIRPLSQQMPKFNMSPEEAKIVATDISKNRRDARIPDSIPDPPVAPQEIEQGRQGFKARGCFSCHTVGEGAGGVVGPDLAAVGDRLKPGFIWYHLKDPHAVNPYSAEPDYGLSDEKAKDEVRALSAYLSTKKKK